MNAETSQTLGEFLRHERERRGMTIEQVASATKINVRMLHALEADHFAELPAKPFVRGFVTSYCRFIGLTPKEILTRFGGFIDAKAHDRPNRDAGHSGYAFEKREGEQSRTVLWFAMGGFITIGAVVFVFLKPSLHHHHSTHLEKLRNAHSNESSGSVAPAEGDEVAAAGGAATKPLASPSPTPSLAPVVESSGPPLVGPVMPMATPIAASVPAALPSTAPAVVTQAPTPVVAAESAAPTQLLPAPLPSAPAPTNASASVTPPAVAPPAANSGFTIDAEPATKDDPLASGVTLKREEIQHKVVFKAGDDVWVRYRVDGKPIMRFILRKDRVLVLRAKKAIQFQTSEPDSITFNYNGQGSKAMSTHSTTSKRRNEDVTLYFPAELSKIIDEPFPGQNSILGLAVPPPRNTAPASTSDQ